MLKMTVSRDQQGTSFTLAGRLAGPWVEELRRCWESEADKPGYRDDASRVDLQETTYVDEAGKALLSEMRRRGAAITARGCLMRAVVEGLTASSAGRVETS